MMRADDMDEFLKVEGPELKGLEDFGVFEYLKIKDIPYEYRSKLLNAIWSYRRKRRPDGSLLKYKVEYVPTVVNRKMVLTSLLMKFIAWLYNGALLESHCYYQNY